MRTRPERSRTSVSGLVKVATVLTLSALVLVASVSVTAVTVRRVPSTGGPAKPLLIALYLFGEPKNCYAGPPLNWNCPTGVASVIPGIRLNDLSFQILSLSGTTNASVRPWLVTYVSGTSSGNGTYQPGIGWTAGGNDLVVILSEFVLSTDLDVGRTGNSLCVLGSGPVDGSLVVPLG